VGTITGFIAGGGGGAGAGFVASAPTGELAAPVLVPAFALGGAIEGAVIGARIGIAMDAVTLMSQAGNSDGGSAPQYKVTASGKSAAEAAKDVPSWAKGNRPLVGENGKDFAKRLLDQQYGEGNWKGTGPTSEFNRIKKWGDRAFVDPKK
jgi:hypothetical protein